MKKYLITLVVLALLFTAPVAYSSTNDIAVIPDISITKAEFAGMLVDMAQLNKEDFSWLEIPRLNEIYADIDINENLIWELDQPLTYTAATKALINILQINEASFSFFVNEEVPEDAMVTAYQLGLLTSLPDSHELGELLSRGEAIKLINNLLAVLSLEMGVQNAAGVSYMLTPQSFNKYSLELFWGSKPSAGYVIKIENTIVRENILYVNYITNSPASGTMSAAVITRPSDFKVLHMERFPSKVILLNEGFFYNQ
ncbi:MAG: protease complex subunit PrcB family protein [Desulfotomaculum sp.]|nr:protease complex subunit PrcB family protein [Desulfotomaculum sp.]